MGDVKRTPYAFIIIILLTTATAYALTADEYRKAGIKYMTQGKIEEAIAELKKALEVDSAYKRARQVKNSLEMAQKVLRGDIKKEAAIHLFKAVDYIDKGMMDKAIMQGKKALKIEPNWAEIYATLGFAYIKKGMFDEAISQCKKAIEIDPNYAEAHAILGSAYLKKDMIDEGIDEFKSAVEIDPSYAEAHVALEAVRLKKGIQEMKQLEKKPESLTSHYTYDPTGKPDPFKPLVFRPEIAHHLTPLQRFEVTQLTLVGILWNDKIAKAVVQDPSGKGYILTKGTLVGTKGGYVKEILKNKVIIEERAKDLMGQVKVTEFELALRKSVEEGGL